VQQRRRREILIETQEVWIVRPHRVNTCWCSTCGEPTAHVSQTEAARLAGLSLDGIQPGVADGRLHVAQTPEGRLFICLNSLLDMN
jgi:hypothetical protein